MATPRRIAGFDYVGLHAYFLTICVEKRRRVFADADRARWAITKLLQIAAANDMSIPAYCVMPDHLHGLVEGTNDGSDFKRFAANFKQRTGFEYRRLSRNQLWQHGYYDHVLRDEESSLSVAAYILQNPVRAGLCAAIEQYPHLGSDRFTIAQLMDAIQWRPPWRPWRP
jgi:putative transposase